MLDNNIPQHVKDEVFFACKKAMKNNGDLVMTRELAVDFAQDYSETADVQTERLLIICSEHQVDVEKIKNELSKLSSGTMKYFNI